MRCRAYSDTTKYPAAEVRRLVEIGCKGVNMADITIQVTGTAGVYSGRCRYWERRIIIRVGRPDKFPADNMDYSRRWRVIPEDQALPTDARTWSPTHGHQIKRLEIRRHPYGGVRSPLIVVNDWREALVAVAAHEARHVQQYQRGWSKSEVDCERFALQALTRYRKDGI